MKAILLDTHAWAWSLTQSHRLSAQAKATISKTQSILVSPISFFEMSEKVRLGKWPEMMPIIDRLPMLLDQQGGMIAALEPIICVIAGTMIWDHRDPFDRLLAATANHYNLPIVSADPVFDDVATRVW